MTILLKLQNNFKLIFLAVILTFCTGCQLQVKQTPIQSFVNQIIRDNVYGKRQKLKTEHLLESQSYI